MTDRPIRRRLTVAFAAFAIACVGLGLLTAYLGTVLSHRSSIDRSILVRAAELLNHHGNRGRASLTHRLDDLAQDPNNELLYSLWSEDRTTAWGGNLPPPAESNGSPEPTNLWVEDRRLRGATFSLPGGDILMVAHDITRQDVFERRLLIASIIAGACVAALAIGVGLWLSRRLVGHIDGMNRIVIDILAGNRTARVPVRDRGDEFDSLAKHFNQLLNENDHLLAQIREVTNSIAHDLRTPLTRVHNELEMALTRPRSGDEDQRTLSAVLAETTTLLKTFHSLLSIAQIESGALRGEMHSVDLTAVVQDAIELFEPAAEDAQVRIAVEAKPDQVVHGHRHLLSHMLSNLIDNALKFSPTGEAIEISVLRNSQRLELCIADHGPGVPAGKRDFVLRRFTQLETPIANPGMGLGLSLVAAITELHGAELTLSDNAPGLKVTVAFPVATPVP